MKRIVKRLGLIFGILLVLLFGGLSLILTFFQEDIGQQVVAAVNGQLKTEMQVGGFDLTLIRTFPNIGVNLQDVTVLGTDAEPLIEAGELSFRAGLFSLLSDALQLKSVVLQDAALHLSIDRNGHANYDIFLDSEPASAEDAGSNARISLGEAIVRNLAISYEDEQAEQDARVQVHKASFEGDFGSTHFRLISRAKSQIDHLVSGGEPLLEGQSFNYEADIDIDNEAGNYTIEQVVIEVGGLPLEVKGKAQSQGKATALDFQFNSEDGTLTEVLALIPGSYQEALRGIESRGDFELSGIIKGLYSDTQQPAVQANLRFANGRLSGERIFAKVRDLGFTAQFTNGKDRNNRTTSLRIDNFTGSMDGEPFNMQLWIKNLDDPTIDFRADGYLPPGLLLGFIPDERITDAEGMIRIQDLRLQGRY
ncbi:MAG: AsmA family protein, partial [Bacteroidetes bacterium]